MHDRERRRFHPSWHDARRTLDHVEDKVSAWQLIERARKRYGLKPRELKVLLLRFGFFGGEVTLRDLGEVIGVTAERVRSIEAGALRRLRKAARLWDKPAEEPYYPPPRSPRPIGPAWKYFPSPPPEPRSSGEIELTCDECRVRFSTMYYSRGQRPTAAAALRAIGRKDGWTCIVGRDRCAACSEVPTPEAIGHGAGAGEGNEQHR